MTCLSSHWKLTKMLCIADCNRMVASWLCHGCIIENGCRVIGHSRAGCRAGCRAEKDRCSSDESIVYLLGQHAVSTSMVDEWTMDSRASMHLSSNKSLTNLGECQTWEWVGNESDECW